MKQFNVEVGCDYVQGHLRYGHFENVVECESEEKLKELIASGEIEEFLGNVIVDDYEIDDYDCDFTQATYEPVQELKDNKLIAGDIELLQEMCEFLEDNNFHTHIELVEKLTGFEFK